MTALQVIASIVIIVIGFVLVVELIVATALLVVLKNLVAELRKHLDPVLAKTNTLLTTANEMAERVQGSTEHIADQAAHTSSVLGDRVETTSRVVERLIAVPVIKGSAALAGLSRGYAIWRNRRQARRMRHEGGNTAL